MDKLENNKCVGNIRVNCRDWFALSDHLNHDNPYDVTYCGFCVDNECVKRDDTYKVNYEKIECWNCNCDCPNKNQHEKKINVSSHFCVTNINYQMVCQHAIWVHV